MRIYWKERVLEFHPNSNQEPFLRQGVPQPDVMDDPNVDPNATGGRIFPTTFQKPPIPSPPGTPQLVPSVQGLTDPSYPLMVDPMGWVARPGRVDKFWVAESTTPNNTFIPRRNLFEVERFNVSSLPATANLLALRLSSLMDGLTYAPDATAADAAGTSTASSGGAVQRELRYNWLWVLQRQNNTDRTSAKMTVVVFDKRSHLFAPATAEQVSTPVAAGVGLSTVSFLAGAEPPGIKKGSWLLDGTTTCDSYLEPQPAPNPPVRRYFSMVRNANFYRVLSVTTNGSSVDVELHQPLKPDTKTRFAPNGPFVGGTTAGGLTAGQPIPDAQPNERRFILLAGVADVFEKNPLTNSTTGP
jgi:hypothetical protein